MTPKERAGAIERIYTRSWEEDWTGTRVHEAVARHIRKAEAAAEKRGELRGKREAFEEMQRWCEEQVEICQCAGPLDGIDGLQTASWYANERARELGGEHPVSLKAQLEAASQEVAESPEWLRTIHERNDALEAHRKRQLDGDDGGSNG